MQQGHKAFEEGAVIKAIEWYNKARWQYSSHDHLAGETNAGFLTLACLLHTPRRDTGLKAYYDTFLSKIPKLKDQNSALYKKSKLLSLDLDRVNNHKVQPLMRRLDSFKATHEISVDSTPFIWAKFYRNKGQLLTQVSKNRKALKAFEKASKSYHESTNPAWIMPALVAKHYISKAVCYQTLGQYDSALQMAFKGKRFTDSAFHENHPINAWMHYRIGKLYAKRAVPLKAIKHFNHASRILKTNSLTLTALKPLLLQKKGNLYAENFQQSKAITYYEKALQTLEKAFPSNPEEKIYPKMELGNVYKNQSRFKKALNNNQDALNIALEFEPSPVRKRFLINIYINSSNIYREKGAYKKSKASLLEALSIAKAYYPNEHQKIGYIYINLMNLTAKQNKLNEAQAHLEKAHKIFRSRFSNDHGKIGRYIYTNQAIIASNAGDFEASGKYMRKAHQTFAKPYSMGEIEVVPPVHATTYPTYAFQTTTIQSEILWRHYRQKPDPKILSQALQVYQFSDSLVEKLQKRHYLAGNQSGLAKHAALIYPYSVAACFQLIQHKQTPKSDDYYRKLAFHHGEKGKTVQLLESLNKIRQQRSKALPDSLHQRIQQLVNKINGLKNQQANSNPEDVKAQLIDLKTRKASLLETIKQEHPDFYALSFHDQVVPLDTIKKQLADKNKNLITYSLRDSLLYGIAISGERIKIENLGAGQNVEDSLKAYRNQLAKQKHYNQSLSHYLYTKLFKPFKPHLDADQIVIIPDGAITHLAFSTLAQQPEALKKPDYLIKDYAFSYSPSASLWMQRQDRAAEENPRLASRRQSFMGFAPVFDGNNENAELIADNRPRQALSAIPGARDEVSFCSRLFGGTALTGIQATEKAFKQQAANSRILHLATHGIVSDEAPAYSSLLFNAEGQESEDGSLYTHELYNLHFNADLAVLSACNTGYGPLKRGQGHMSMARGFKLAGCQNVIMTLWQIQDNNSSDLVRSFYRHLDKGKTIPKALRSAKLEYLRTHDPNNSNPYYWGGFVLMGSDKTIDFKDGYALPDSFWIWLIIGGVVFVTVFGFLYGWYCRIYKT